MMRAYQEYFALKQDDRNQLIEQQKLNPRDVIYSIFTPINTGHKNYRYIITRTLTTLAANEKTSIIGPSGLCGGLTRGSIQFANAVAE